MSLVMHHIIMDGMSMDIMMSELVAAYTSFQQEQCPELPPLPVQYVDFTHWQQELVAAEVWKPQVGTLHLCACNDGVSLHTIISAIVLACILF